MHIGDVVQDLQRAKFSSPYWKLPGIEEQPVYLEYHVKAEIAFYAETHPLSTTVIVQEILGVEEVYGYQRVYMTTHIPVADVLAAVQLVFPQFKIPENLKPYANLYQQST